MFLVFVVNCIISSKFFKPTPLFPYIFLNCASSRLGFKRSECVYLPSCVSAIYEKFMPGLPANLKQGRVTRGAEPSSPVAPIRQPGSTSPQATHRHVSESSQDQQSWLANPSLDLLTPGCPADTHEENNAFCYTPLRILFFLFCYLTILFIIFNQYHIINMMYKLEKYCLIPFRDLFLWKS